jgi:co-chaperonin GroES (HSP10)
MKIQGKVVPIKDRVFFTDMNFEEETTAGGIVLQSDNGKGGGVKPRWGRVWAIGPDQKDVKVGEWILVEHGRWTRTFELENDDGSITKLQVADNKGIMLSADEKPAGAERAIAATAGGNFNFNIPGA